MQTRETNLTTSMSQQFHLIRSIYLSSAGMLFSATHCKVWQLFEHVVTVAFPNNQKNPVMLQEKQCACAYVCVSSTSLLRGVSWLRVTVWLRYFPTAGTELWEMSHSCSSCSQAVSCASLKAIWRWEGVAVGLRAWCLTFLVQLAHLTSHFPDVLLVGHY